MDNVKKLIAQFPCFQDCSSASQDRKFNGETFEVYTLIYVEHLHFRYANITLHSFCHHEFVNSR